MIILIADDDRLIRFTVKSMLSNVLGGEHTIIEAANGREMVDRCLENQPDIVFADIQMPYMSGLDAIEECKKQVKDTEFVIISGYSEFEYAKRGIVLGIHEYLLKPVDEEQLEKVMKTLQQKLEKKKQDVNVTFRLKLLDIFHYFSIAGFQEEYEEFQLPEGYTYLAAGVIMRNGKKKDEEAAVQKGILEELREIGANTIKNGGYYTDVYSVNGTPYAVFAVENTEKVLSGLQKKNLLSVPKNSARIFWFAADSMKHLCETAEELDENVVVEMNEKPGVLLAYRDITIGKDELALLHHIRRLLDAWNRADGVEYKEILNRMYREYKDKDLDWNLKYVAAYCAEVTDKKISAESYKEFCHSFVDIAEEMYENVSGDEGDLIEEIKEYMQKNYKSDISISQLGERYHLTANYLSTLFHQKAGCKFIDYLTEIRMTEAKRLLILNGTASVQDIALMVGYNSARHFSTLFQKETGMTPTAYRKSKL